LPLRAHAWTVAPTLIHRVLGRQAPQAEPWETTLHDPVAGVVRLTGRLRRGANGNTVLVVLHGLGGSHASFYAVRAARAAEQAGLDCLRLNLRGADRSGQDYYHAGLTADLEAALASPGLASYRRVFVLGYSLGGHMALRYATGRLDPRVHAVAAVCSPLDLEACCEAIDRPEMWVYRRYLLAGLNRIYARVAQRRPVPTPPAQARRIRTLRAWDDAVVAPRHGFASAHDYYSQTSVGPRLGQLAVPCLLVAAERDPMVPLNTLRPWLYPAPPSLEFHLAREGGHVGFPAGLDLEQDAPRGLEGQVMGWLQRAPCRQVWGASEAAGGVAGMRALTPNS